MKYYLYTLSNPITKEIRYIGKTNNLARRYSAHLNEKSKSYKNSWIKSLIIQGIIPIIEELDSFDTEKECYENEIFWIEQFKHWGFNLTNLQIGGIGGTSNNLNCENNPNAILTNTQVLEIKDLLLNTNLSIKSIAAKFNINERIIYNITSGQSWGKITGFTGKEKWVRGESIEIRKNALKNSGLYEKLSIKVVQYDLDGNFIKEYSSISEASRETKENYTSISLCINNKQKKTKNFIWKKSVK